MKLSLLAILTIIICNHPLKAQNSEPLPKPMQGIQYFPDSVRVEFQDQNAIVLFQFKQIKEDLKKLEDFPKQLLKINKLATESLPDFTVPKRLTVVQMTENTWSLTIEDNTAVTKVKFADDAIEELLPPGWDIDIETIYAHIHVYIHQWKDLQAVANEDFVAISNAIKAKMESEHIGRKRTISRTILSNRSISFSETKFQMPIDMLALNASFAFGYFRNSYYPEITFSAMIMRKDHFNRPCTQFGLIYENKFFTTSTENGFNAHTNSFLSLGFSINAHTSDDPFWIGFGGGLLVRNRGDYFEGNTAKFYITTGSKRLRVIPEFYLTNDYKTFSLGGKLSYTF